MLAVVLLKSWAERLRERIHCDEAGCDFQGATEKKLPDEQKGHQSAPSLSTIALQQVQIRAARSRQGRAQLAPDETVEKNEQTRNQPTEKGVGAGQFFEHQRNGDEY